MCGKEVRKWRIECRWGGVGGERCQEGSITKVLGKIYKRVVRPAVMFGLETVSLIKNQDSELKMLRFSLSDEDRQDNEWSHQGDGTGQTFIRKSLRGQIEMVWTSAEEGQ